MRLDRPLVDVSDELTQLVRRPEVDGVTDRRQYAPASTVYQRDHVITLDRTRRQSHAGVSRPPDT